MPFQESGFSFEFPASWTVVKFDDHRFYKYLSGDGFKGVDFLCLDETGAIVFVEIKNYLNLFLADDIDPVDNLILDPDSYALTYWNKYQDSIHLIELIHKYYLRKWWFRLLVKYASPKLFQSALKKDWGFWTTVFQKLKSHDDDHHLLLWLELNRKEAATGQALNKIKVFLQNKAQDKNVKINILHSAAPGPIKAKSVT